MKKALLFILSSILLFVLGACSKELSKEEVISEMNDHADEVENYHTLVDFEVTAVNGDEENKSVAKTETDVMESTNEIAGTVNSKQGDVKTTVEYYITKDYAVGYMEGSGWQQIPNEPNQFLDEKAYYNEIRKMVDSIRNDLEMELKDDQYVFTFQGMSQDIYDAFESPYHLQVTGVDEDEMDHDVIIKVNQDTFYIEHVENILTGESDQGKLTISIKHNYTDFGNIESIEIPDDVMDEIAQPSP